MPGSEQAGEYEIRSGVCPDCGNAVAVRIFVLTTRRLSFAEKFGKSLMWNEAKEACVKCNGKVKE